MKKSFFVVFMPLMVACCVTQVEGSTYEEATQKATIMTKAEPLGMQDCHAEGQYLKNFEYDSNKRSYQLTVSFICKTAYVVVSPTRPGCVALAHRSNYYRDYSVTKYQFPMHVLGPFAKASKTTETTPGACMFKSGYGISTQVEKVTGGYSIMKTTIDLEYGSPDPGSESAQCTISAIFGNLHLGSSLTLNTPSGEQSVSLASVKDMKTNTTNGSESSRVGFTTLDEPTIEQTTFESFPSCGANAAIPSGSFSDTASMEIKAHRTVKDGESISTSPVKFVIRSKPSTVTSAKDMGNKCSIGTMTSQLTSLGNSISREDLSARLECSLPWSTVKNWDAVWIGVDGESDQHMNIYDQLGCSFVYRNDDWPPMEIVLYVTIALAVLWCLCCCIGALAFVWCKSRRAQASDSELEYTRMPEEGKIGSEEKI